MLTKNSYYSDYVCPGFFLRVAKKSGIRNTALANLSLLQDRLYLEHVSLKLDECSPTINEDEGVYKFPSIVIFRISWVYRVWVIFFEVV